MAGGSYRKSRIQPIWREGRHRLYRPVVGRTRADLFHASAPLCRSIAAFSALCRNGVSPRSSRCQWNLTWTSWPLSVRMVFIRNGNLAMT